MSRIDAVGPMIAQHHKFPKIGSNGTQKAKYLWPILLLLLKEGIFQLKVQIIIKYNKNYLKNYTFSNSYIFNKK